MLAFCQGLSVAVNDIFREQRATKGRTRAETASSAEPRNAVRTARDPATFGPLRKQQANREQLAFKSGGEDEDRTPDLRTTNATLSQLSYPPHAFTGQFSPARGAEVGLAGRAEAR